MGSDVSKKSKGFYPGRKYPINSASTERITTPHRLPTGSAAEASVLPPLRLVLVGMSGVGKSAAGNTILGRKAFRSDTICSSLTLTSERREGDVFGRRVLIVDTPGLWNTDISEEKLREEMQTALAYCEPGPDAFLLVIQLGRFTQQEKRVMETLQELFYKRVTQQTMILFTYGDRLKKKTIEEFISNNANLQELLKKCGYGYHVFNNEDMENRFQVSELLQKIGNMVATEMNTLDEGGRQTPITNILPNDVPSLGYWGISWGFVAAVCRYIPEAYIVKRTPKFRCIITPLPTGSAAECSSSQGHFQSTRRDSAKDSYEQEKRDKELSRVRTEFVDRVTETVLKQLLDGLLEDRVINAGEKDAMNERNNTTVDMAGCFIYTVLKKGPKASEKLISSLKVRDPHLYDLLNLAPPESPDKQLFHARKKFVDGVSKDVIMQLLDDLLEDGVINDGEKDAVIEENRTGTDKARCLIDKVRKKGPKASEKLISSLKVRDPHLYDQLNLAPPMSPDLSQPQTLPRSPPTLQGDPISPSDPAPRWHSCIMQ